MVIIPIIRIPLIVQTAILNPAFAKIFFEKQ